MNSTAVFIQARMSSQRFPGKVLAPFRGRPLIHHVLTRVRQAFPERTCVVVTSGEASDDPLCAYLPQLDCAFVRGPLNDVVRRFELAWQRCPADWILRICADSPLQSLFVLQAIDRLPRAGQDLLTTTWPRSFPRGQNVELIRAEALRSLARENLEPADREHVTRWFYRHPDRYQIANLASGRPELAEVSLAVDEVADLQRLEACSEAELEQYQHSFLAVAG